MKIRTADSTGRPEPQFVVEAETDEDCLFLKMFLQAPNYSKEKLMFWLHGWTSQNGKYKTFNFGWISLKNNGGTPEVAPKGGSERQS